MPLGTFTTQEAIAIQTRQLKDWEELLKPKVHKALKKWATEKNHLKENATDIIRGTDLDSFIANYTIGYTPQN